jgi:hypothetical protein
MTHPYASAADHQFWSRAMSWPAPGQVDPVIRGVRIRPDEAVVTLGSCFAQHIARHLARSGCHYLVTESAPATMAAEEAERRQFGVFSARYGNVYTVRQAVQLLHRAYSRFVPVEGAWPRSGRWVDPFRPQIEPEGFVSADAVAAAREGHLASVRDALQRADWVVFTLGLTEAWRSKIDGSVYPLAPGVAGGEFDAARHEFVNFNAEQVRRDLFEFIEGLKAINAGARMILTVSPVPLAATFENRHVWVSTTVSKAILRVAADEAERAFSHVRYFPSYEVITSPAAEGRYYADDLRQVTELGVRHVMRLFTAHYLNDAGAAAPGLASTVKAEDALTGHDDVVCDEETIERSLRQASVR